MKALSRQRGGYCEVPCFARVNLGRAWTQVCNRWKLISNLLSKGGSRRGTLLKEGCSAQGRMRCGCCFSSRNSVEMTCMYVSKSEERENSARELLG